MIKDKHFRISVIRRMPNPQQVIWAAMHQDYAEDMAVEDIPKGNCPKTEKEAGDLVIKHLLKGGRGHYGPLEHPQIVLNAGHFPHSTMQQLRTHRVGISFDVQSFRYTGQRIVDVTTGKRDVEDVFYLRPTGNYTDRKGHHYGYTSAEREEDKRWCVAASERYAKRMKLGHSEEHARSFIPFDIRQHFVISMNVRSLMHLLDLRWKKDAQLEAQAFCEHLWPHFKNWCPQIAGWYAENRAHKARLAP